MAYKNIPARTPLPIAGVIEASTENPQHFVHLKFTTPIYSDMHQKVIEGADISKHGYPSPPPVGTLTLCRLFIDGQSIILTPLASLETHPGHITSVDEGTLTFTFSKEANFKLHAGDPARILSKPATSTVTLNRKEFPHIDTPQKTQIYTDEYGTIYDIKGPG